ncbi:MAG: aminoacyl-tRNA hydrolase [Chloroflexi bacterium]|nr:aminoacyl-tRNA hydrolase [Chloroflexota bacterium]
MTYGEKNEKDIRITSELAIPLSELEFRFSRSSGPGGQRVNRRETRVELLFDVQHSPSLNEAQRTRLLNRLANHIDSEGILRIVATTYRSQLRNREEALERFVQIIRRGLHVPRRRLSTRPSPQSVQQRLEQKRRRGQIKALRKRIPLDTSE